MRIEGNKGDAYQPKSGEELANLKNELLALQKLAKKNESKKFKTDFEAFTKNLDKMLESKSLPKHQREVLEKLRNTLSQTPDVTASGGKGYGVGTVPPPTEADFRQEVIQKFLDL